jgi:hypothetical protein
MLGVLLASLAACGSSDNKIVTTTPGGVCLETRLENCGPGPWDPFGIALAFAWVSGQCTMEVRCESTPVQTDFSSGIVTDSFINANWRVGSVPDREPNDTIDNAMPVVLQAGGAIFLNGTVNDTSDPGDVLALAIDSTNDLIAIYLCVTPQDCTAPFLQTDEIHIDLFDQNGQLIETTNMMQSANGHSIAFLPAAGLGYFVRVTARDTVGADFAYRLNIVD